MKVSGDSIKMLSASRPSSILEDIATTPSFDLAKTYRTCSYFIV